VIVNGVDTFVMEYLEKGRAAGNWGISIIFQKVFSFAADPALPEALDLV